MKSPATPRIILRPRSSLSVRSSPEAVSSRKPPQQRNAQLLHDQIAGKAAGILDEDNANAITLEAVEQPGEALPALDRIGTTDRASMPIAIGDLEASSLGESPDGGSESGRRQR